MSERILITGATGSLGSVVYRRAARAGWNTVGTSFSSPSDVTDVRLDVRDPVQVREVLDKVRPAVVVHTATGREREDWATTADGAANVAAAAARLGVRLVHVSTDAVHRGDGSYDESALPDPVNRYGAAKAAAETAVKAIAPEAAIVRTGLIGGDGDGYFERLTYELVHGQREGFLFTDMVRTPVHVDDLADALLELAGNDFSGVLNVAGSEAITRYELGVLVARRDGLDPAAIPAKRAVDMDPRPALALDVRLDISRARSLLRTRLRGASEFMAEPIGG
ncbi:SDR family oxidoreductase [Stackebrandtia nassauensis]|uniref:NAD-dependent epimerase/dehydratase n=1 Tax=Stackebrandtia nassauensis (strain DSM 44728 / CIP 108903 / NRRL B-16338 / NBRC 102104 / LLR-40K-21) TaxID=446470 RepID=D3PU12_STANL|nr:sugar nucleotide-binding protein [Stackebrandtia nassauensis]ADD40958.1 NAD-dependent epimerase/dehydratase [Stackebrandtia nassauensis DSM 44728]